MPFIDERSSERTCPTAAFSPRIDGIGRALTKRPVKPQRTGSSKQSIIIPAQENIAWEQRSDNLKIGQKMVPRDGIEPPTLRFSVACSTN